MVVDPYAKTVHCPYTISIDGSRLIGDGTECFESRSAKGVIAEVTPTDPTTPELLQKVLVWDENAPCDGIPGQSYIHYSGPTSNFVGMTAGGGDWMHIYKAAVFAEGIPVPPGTVGCYPFTSRGNDAIMPICLETWRVARQGSECPNYATAPSFMAWTALVSTSLAVTAVVGFLICRCRRRHRSKADPEAGEGIFAEDKATMDLTPMDLVLEGSETVPALEPTIAQLPVEPPVGPESGVGEIKVTATIV